MNNSPIAPAFRHQPSRVTDRPPLYYHEEQAAAGAAKPPVWYDSLLQQQQLQLQQQHLLKSLQPLAKPYSTLQLRRRPATVVDRGARAPLQLLQPLNWDLPSGGEPPAPPPHASAAAHLRGRPREIKRGTATVASPRSGSQAPPPEGGRHESAMATAVDCKESKKEAIGLRRSARRSLSRSRLLQAVLAVPRRANETLRWLRDDDQKVEDYLPSPSLYQSLHHKSSTQLYPTVTTAGASPTPSSGSHYSVVRTAATRPSRPPSAARTMRVVVMGAKRVGKTSILRQVACIEDITAKPYTPTIEDTYQVLLEDGDRPREILIFHDTAGLPDHGSNELKRSYLNVADAFVLVYSIIDHESFNRVDQIKKMIDKHYAKEKKEVPIVVLGNMTDLPGRKVDSEFALNWGQREKVKLFELTATERNSLIDFVHYIGQRHFHPQKESKFSLSKKLKSEKTNNAILMDF